MVAPKVNGAEADFPNRPITIICPWAAGGGTDRVSRQIASQLERRLGVPVNVVNATGGKGVTGHHRGLTARPDGYTVAMMTFELCTMHWMGLTDLTYEDAVPLVSVNEDYAALLVAQDAAWQNLQELEQAILSSSKPLSASGTAAGGAWHLAQAGWLDAAGIDQDRVTWVPSQGSSPSLQQLLAGGVDMVCCSLPEARSLLESGTVRALGVMSPVRAVGFEDIPTFLEQGRTWELGGWRGLGLPKGVPEERVQILREALTEIVTQSADDPDSFAAFMRKQKFDATTRSATEFRDFMGVNDEVLGKLIRSPAFASTRTDRFSPMTFPLLIAGLLLVSGFAALPRQRKSISAELDGNQAGQSRRNYIGPSGVVLSIVLYCLLAEQLGFVPTAAIMMVAMLAACRSMTWARLATAMALPVIVYVVFAWGLRVGLPVGPWA